MGYGLPEAAEISRCHTGGLPGELNLVRIHKSEARLCTFIATSLFKALRRPVESAQYASETYRRALDAAGLQGSMSAIGNPYHNAQAAGSNGGSLYLGAFGDQGLLA